MAARRNTPEADRLDILVTLSEAYEAKHFPLDLPDPVEVIKFVMEQRNLTVKDLVARKGATRRPTFPSSTLRRRLSFGPEAAGRLSAEDATRLLPGDEGIGSDLAAHYRG